ncbi:RDD family protein [Streptomyces sp. NPDC088760]|uniref:RDD family protein n=1 Tax=Streptomyces sp. NPDC088760 TaxID=3365890 RepID=UPI0038283F25
MSAPTPAPGDDRPREGYYPDPSIPGYVRYWNGASWVPGTSRPAPKDGEPLTPPPGARPALPAVEETGPHFFDEDPLDVPQQGGTGVSGAAGQPGAVGRPDAAGQGAGGQGGPGAQWVQAGRGAQGAHWGEPGVPGQVDRAGQAGQAAQAGQVAQGAQWNQSAQSAQPGLPGQSGGPAQWGGSGQPGRTAQPGQPGQSAQGAQSAGFGGDAGRGGAWGADPRVPADSSGGPDGRATARTDGAATIPPAEDDAPDPGTFIFRRPIPGPAAARTDDGTMTFRPVPSGTPGPSAAPAPSGTPGPAPAPAPESGSPGFGAQGPVGAPAGSGFGAGKAAAARAAGDQAPPAQGAQAPQPAPAVPLQAGPGQAAASGTPLTSGAGGGQASWAQQVHQLAGGGDEQPVAPWKPPVEDLFQAAARRQASARPAGLGKRLAARLIDLLAVGALTSAAAVPLGMRAVDHVQQKIDAARLSGREVTVWLLDGTTGTSLGIVLAVLLLAGVLYEVLPTVKWGRTLGKKLCGLEVRDIEGHEPPTFGPALRRWLVLSVPVLLVVGIVGVLWCLFDRPWRQGWHDKAAHTFVAG